MMNFAKQVTTVYELNYAVSTFQKRRKNGFAVIEYFMRDTLCIATSKFQRENFFQKLFPTAAKFLVGIFRATEQRNLLLRCKLNITNFTVLILEKISVTQKAQQNVATN